MGEHSFRIDDRVIIDPAVASRAVAGIVYRVTKVNPVNLLLTPEGGGRRVKVNPIHVRPAPEATATAETDGNGAAQFVPLPPPLYPATLVAPAIPNTSLGDHLYVVIRDNVDTVSIARLGGDSGRYFRGVLKSRLEVIAPSRIPAGRAWLLEGPAPGA